MHPTNGKMSQSPLQQPRILLNSDLQGFESLRISEAAEYYKAVSYSVIDIISKSTNCENISIYATGLEPGYFSKLISKGTFQEEERYLTNSQSIHFIRKIQALSQENFQGLKEQGACEVMDQRSVSFYLFGRGEIFGFILLRRVENIETVQTFFHEHAHEINAILADQAFSYRMNTISEPLLDPTQTEDFLEPFGKQIAELTTRGFGADGSTFRIFSNDKLRVIGSAGNVNDKIISARQSGEKLSGLLFDSIDDDWAAIILSEDDELSIGGLHVPKNVKDELRLNGLYSVLMCKLFGRNTSGNLENYGTLSYYFLRTTAYSRRDVSLFKSFAQRVSAYLTMHFSYSELQQKKDIIEQQGRIMTFSEVANLLAHDIWHKSNALSHDAEVLESVLRRSISRDRLNGKETLLADLLNDADKLTFSANALQETTSKYKKLQQADSESIYKKSSFTLLEAVDSVKLTL